MYSVNQILELLNEYGISISRQALHHTLKKRLSEDKDYKKTPFIVISERGKNKLISIYKERYNIKG